MSDERRPLRSKLEQALHGGPGETSVVTAGEISRNFGQWQDRALGGPVIVTHHGRPRVVLISAEYYSRQRGGSGSVLAGAQPSCETGRSAILDHVSEAFMALDAELKVTAVNHVFEALTGEGAPRMVGRSWEDLFPIAARVQMAEQLRRVLQTGEVLNFEAPGDCNAVRRYTVRAFPYPGGVAVLIRNRTAEHEMRRKVRQARALEAALGALPQVMVLKLNVRGLITSVDPTFCELVGFSQDELLACRLHDIVRPRDRAGLAAIIEAVLQGGEARQFRTALLVKNAGETPAQIGIAPAMDDLVPDSMIIALTRDETAVDAGDD